MSTELFRQYIDLLNEAVTQSEIDNQLLPALKELERILGKYRGKIYEADLEDPPLFGPGNEPAPLKPRYKPGPNGTLLQQTASGSWEPVPPMPTSTANNPFGVRPGEASISASPSTTGSAAGNPFTRDAQGRPIPEVPSTGGTITRTPTGTVHTAPPPSPWKLRGKVAAYTTAALAAGGYAAYELWQLITRNSGYALRDLDPVDQESIKKNLKILEPFVVPDVFKTLPADLQTRIGTVLDQLKKLGMSAGGDKAAQQPVAAPATPASAAAPAGEESFADTLQNAYRYVKGVRESVEPVGLSEAENMAQLRDLVQENLPLAAAAAEALAGPFVQQVIAVAKDLGLGYVVIKAPGSIEKLVTRFIKDVPNGTAEDFWKWLVKLNIPNKSEALAMGIGAAGYAFYTWFQVQATTGAAKAAVTALTKDWPAENNALKAFKDRMARMTPAEYKARSDDEKDKIDETWIYYCSKFPSDKIGNQTCFDLVHNPTNGICTYHPDWAGCKKPSATQ
jgi:hypothetical protein